ncbi:MAG TPA: spore germination protein GerPE [Bacillus bacterium]|nr:spore germination protein GerPE [Bacillus sp. (in: firmicutes)]
MQQRLSIVDKLQIRSVFLSSIIEIGDSNMVLPFSRALAVHREHQLLGGGEGSMNYPIFYRPLPRPIITEQVSVRRMNESPKIHVHSISIIGLSTSSVVHIGSTNLIYGEGRVKHIRQLIDAKQDIQTVEISK